MTRLVLLAFGAYVAALPQAHAQTPAPLTPPGAAGSGATTPVPTPDPGLSKGSVVRPGNPDPGITVAPPQVGITPVIPAPGMTGNGTPVLPK